LNIIITGVSGFLGKNFVSYFKDFMISGVVRDSSSKEKFKEFPNVVLTSWDKLGHLDENLNAILHAAGKAHDLENTANPEDYYSINFELTKNLYDSFLRSNAKKFIFISSVKASADQIEGMLKESDIPDPKTHYGKSKLMAEKYIQDQILPSGKSFFILRPCMIHGPWNKGNLNSLYKLISKGFPYPLAAFENKRSFLSIENLCFIIRELLERDDIPSGIYNVADDYPLSTNELIKLIAKISGVKPRLWAINPKLIRSLAKLGDLFKLPISTERLNKLTENYVIDNSKLRHFLGKELPVSVKEGFFKTFNFFSSNA
jgi:nucleoside-diphosphate-sugar epimerase